MFAWELEQAAEGATSVRSGNCAVVPDGRGRYLAFFEARVRVEDLDGALMEVRKRLIQVAGIGPSAVACLAHGTLPKTPSGKLRRTVIAALAGELVDTSLAHRDF